MSEFDSTFLYRLVLSETRLLEFLDRKHQQLVNLFLKLRYTRENWNLIMFIFRKDPMRIAFVIVARFLRGFLPSLDMKIEADFLDVVQAAIAKKPFQKRRLYTLAALQVVSYYLDSSLSVWLQSLDRQISRVISRHLQKSLLHAYLRLSVIDLQNPKVKKSYNTANSFTLSSLNTLLGPIRVFQNLTSATLQLWTLRRVLQDKGKNAHALIALHTFNPIFATFYAWVLEKPDNHGPTSRQHHLTVERDWDHMQAENRSKRFYGMATGAQARPEVSIFGLKDWILGTYERLSGMIEDKRLDAREMGIHGSLRGGVRNLIHAISYTLVATKYSQEISLATVELLRYATWGTVYNLLAIYQNCKDHVDGLERIKAYFDFIDPEVNQSSTARIPPFAEYSEPTGRGMKITATNLTFAYPSGKPILKDLNFTIEPGECVAIIGGNGSGKSTLVKLFQRLYDATSGSLSINDVDIRHYDPDELWSRMAPINQDFGKYEDLTIGENIGIGDVSMIEDRDAITKAAAAGEALDFISALPETFETIITEDTYELTRSQKVKVKTAFSGGQWQRIALSRAFMRLHSADLLLLDEPSAALDPEAEYNLFKRLKEGRKGKTTVYISHRFNTVRAASRIMVIENGVLMEFGTHEELLALNGRYAYLYGLQTDALAKTEEKNGISQTGDKSIDETTLVGAQDEA